MCACNTVIVLLSECTHPVRVCVWESVIGGSSNDNLTWQKCLCVNAVCKVSDVSVVIEQPSFNHYMYTPGLTHTHTHTGMKTELDSGEHGPDRNGADFRIRKAQVRYKCRHTPTNNVCVSA